MVVNTPKSCYPFFLFSNSSVSYQFQLFLFLPPTCGGKEKEGWLALELTSFSLLSPASFSVSPSGFHLGEVRWNALLAFFNRLVPAISAGTAFLGFLQLFFFFSFLSLSLSLSLFCTSRRTVGGQRYLQDL